MVWTHFNDMHSGGGTKVNGYEHIFIEAPLDVAKMVFYNRFERNPSRTTCTCCGPDYSIEEKPTLKQASGYERNCRNLKTPRDENGLYKYGLDKIQNQYYLEPGDEPPDGFEVSDRPPIGEYIPLEEYVERDDVLVVHAAEIKDDEKQGTVPKEGYVWAGGS